MQFIMVSILFFLNCQITLKLYGTYKIYKFKNVSIIFLFFYFFNFIENLLLLMKLLKQSLSNNSFFYLIG